VLLSFSLFRAALPLVRGGTSVERNGEGEGTGVERCSGWWRQMRYADGGLTIADVRMTFGSS